MRLNMEHEKEDTYYAEIHHLRLMVKLKDDRLKMYENLVKEMKQELEILKQKTLRIISFIETISEEFSKFAKKEDLEILIKQAKMFQPMLSRK